ncbi:unnamed protein product [Heterosigma akashiwo]
MDEKSLEGVATQLCSLSLANNQPPVPPGLGRGHAGHVRGGEAPADHPPRPGLWGGQFETTRHSCRQHPNLRCHGEWDQRPKSHEMNGTKQTEENIL